MNIQLEGREATTSSRVPGSSNRKHEILSPLKASDLPKFNAIWLTDEAPNGAAMRPNIPYQKQVVLNIFKGNDVLVYSVPAGMFSMFPPSLSTHSFTRGTPIPNDLVLVHERSDHYSLQPAVQMSLEGILKDLSRLNYADSDQT